MFQSMTTYNLKRLIDFHIVRLCDFGKQVEELITRIAQKARAAGIHLTSAILIG